MILTRSRCVQRCSCPGETACCRAKSTETDADMFKDSNLRFQGKYTKDLNVGLRKYLQQVRGDVEAEVLPVLLLQLHPLVEEHVGTVCLQGRTT